VRRLVAIALLLSACRPALGPERAGVGAGSSPLPRPATSAPLDAAQLYRQAQEQLLLGRWDVAQALADQGRAARRGPDEPTEWAFVVLQAEIQSARGHYPSALALLAKEPPQAGAAVQVRAEITRALAACLAASNDSGRAAAEQRLAAAEQAALNLGDGRLVADAAVRHARCLARRERLGEAELALGRALEAARAAASLGHEMVATGSLGYVLMTRERYDDALRWLDRSSALGRLLGSDLAFVRNGGNLAHCHLLLGEPAAALALLREVLERAERGGYEESHLVALIDAGDASTLLREFGAAAGYYERALALARKRDDLAQEARVENSLATLAAARGRLDEAGQRAAHALELKLAAQDLAGAEHARLLVADLARRRGDLAEAQRSYRTVLAAPAAERRVRWSARARLASVLADTHHDAAAEAEFVAAFASMEAGRDALSSPETRLAFVAALRQFHDDYVDFLVGRGRVVEALEVAERGRARLLAERLGQTGQAARRARAADLQALAGRLPATLLAYRLGAQRSLVWAVTARAIELRSLPGEAELCALVAGHQALIQRGRDPVSEERPESRALADALLHPVAEHLPRGGRVVLALDGCLGQLNFETLPAPGVARQYWIEQALVEVAPSLAVLATAPPAPARLAEDARLLVIGDALEVVPEFPTLANAGREIEGLVAQFPPGRAEAYTRAAADPGAYARARPERFDLVHFAAHVQANPDRALESAVVLSPRGTRYKLYARDVLEQRLSADLVTLSACRGAGARSYAGEGLVGLAWAFMSAGARRVVAGLWNVEDASTPRLMERFYRGLRAGRSTAQALRDAKLEQLRGQGPERRPFYWAPFVLYVRATGR
jgi:CHAT domain-containing protein